MNRRKKDRPPLPGMKWNRKHKMWVDGDTRSKERLAEDNRILLKVRSDEGRIHSVLRDVEAAQARHDSVMESAAVSLAQSLLASLVDARKRRGFSQAEVARRMGVSQPVVVRLEAGTHSPTLSTLSRYAAAIGAIFGVHETA